MKYTKFEINNFKGIKSLVLDFGEKKEFEIFTLVGLNESGKTTILEAIDFLQKDMLESERHTLIPKDRKTNFNDHISVKATLELNDEDEEIIKKYSKSVGFIIEQPIKSFVVEKKYNFENSKFETQEVSWEIKIIGKYKGSKKPRELDSGREQWNKIIEKIEKELLPPIIYYPNFLISFPNKIYLRAYPEESQEQEFYRQVIQDILDSLDNGLTIDQHIIERLEENTEQNKQALDAVMDRMGEKINNTALSSWEKIFRETNGRRQIVIIPQIEAVDENQKRYYLEIKLKVGSESYYIHELSLGFKWFFAFLLFIQFRKHRSKDKGERLFLLDEPASNLHSTAQEKLLERFSEIISKRSKLLYTTHSHHLINPEWLEGAFIIRNNALNYDVVNIGSSNISIEAIPYKQFVSKYPDQETYFKPILDSLDYKPSNLELVPKIVIVEGKNDFYTFKYLNEIILGKDKNSINFYPGNGAGKNDKVVRLYVSWGRKLLVFMDGDKAGRDAKAKYINEIGGVDPENIFTLQDIDKGWKNKTTEEIFTKNEQLRLVQAIDPCCKKITKIKLNNAIQNLLFLRQKTDLNEATIIKFEKIFKFIDDRLK